MELASWYTILSFALMALAFVERFVIYKALVGANKILPEKAALIANICAGSTFAVGVLLLVFNSVLKH